MSSRKTAIRVTRSAALAEREGIENLAAAEVAADERRDATPPRKMSTAEILRRARNRSTDAERELVYLERCRDAAALEMRGDGFSPDDRADVAAELLARICADHPHGLPEIDDPATSLTVLCGRVANYRRSIQAKRERDHAEYLDTAAERAASAESVALAQTLERAAMAAAAAPEIAAAQCRRILAALELDPDGPSFAPLYQWMRDAPGPQCADECGYTAGSWRVRVSNGGKLLRALHADAAQLLAAILPDDAGISDHRGADGERVELVYCAQDLSREAATHGKTWSGRKLREISAQWREGTDAGTRPERPADADAARERCAVTFIDDDAAGLASDAAARRHIARTNRRRILRRGDAVMVIDGTDATQERADATRAAGRAAAAQTHRAERAAATASAIPAARADLAA